jgi:hypothetical protein
MDSLSFPIYLFIKLFVKKSANFNYRCTLLFNEYVLLLLSNAFIYLEIKYFNYMQFGFFIVSLSNDFYINDIIMYPFL